MTSKVFNKKRNLKIGKNAKSIKKAKHDEIESVSESDSETGFGSLSEYDDEENYETAHEKKVRLTKKLIEKAREEAEDDSDVDALGLRLKEEALEMAGKVTKQVALKYGPPDEADDEILTLKGHNQPITCIAISNDSKFIFSAGKDSAVIKWSAVDGKKIKMIPGGRKNTKHPFHTAQVLAMAISTDGKFLVTGDADNKIYVWNPDTMEKLKVLARHRGPVTALSFRKHSHQLFSGCQDGNVYVWNLDIMALVEDLVGHKSAITGVDSLTRDRCISCSGGWDLSIRIWKIPEQCNLEYKLKSSLENSFDCVSLVNEEKFITGSNTNRLYLWTVNRSGPVHTITAAHPSPMETEMWVTSVAALHCTDLVASGAWDGQIRLWRIADLQKDKPKLVPHFTIPMLGFVNALEFSSDGSFLVAGIGQEHRRGRWQPRCKEAKNVVKIIRFKRQL